MMDQPETPTTTRQWWIRPIRLLWRVLRYFWATLIFGSLLSIIISFISSVLPLPRGTDLHALYVGAVWDWVGQHLILIIVILLPPITLTMLTWLVVSRFDTAPAAQQASISPDLSHHNRTALLRMLGQEYSRRLTHSLQGAAAIVLGLQERSDVILSPAQLVFSRSEAVEAQLLPPGTSIVQAYDAAVQGLLILGGPGAGKTTLLLDLARELLNRAEGDPTHPIPVILNLSSWALKKPPLATWLIDQLQLVYRIPTRISQAWLGQEQWLVLLDGLDEVEASVQSKCIEAINTYQGAHFVPLVVCSRSRAYLGQEARLALPNAVEIQPLDEQLVAKYLKQVGKPMAAIRTVVSTNPILRQLITTPLMLSVVILAYRNKAARDLPQLGTAEEQQQQIFKRYIERVLEQRATPGDFTPQQTRQWLTWLAQCMQQNSLSEFYLERLQPTWLATKQSQTLYALLFGLSVGLLGGLLTGMVSELSFGLVFGPMLRLVIGPVFGLAFGLAFGLDKKNRAIRLVEVVTWSWRGFRNLRQVLPYFGLLILFTGLVFGLLFGLLFGLGVGLGVGLGTGLGTGLLGWLLGWLLGGISFAESTEHLRIKPNQGIQSSGRNAFRMGLLGGLFTWLLMGLFGGLLRGPIFGLLFGLAFGLFLGSFTGLFSGGGAYLKHYILRFLLWRSGAIPWHYIRFLEEATERILLQRVGGGYRFIHPLFLDHFATHSTEADPSPVPQSSVQ